ncbi:MAG: squalene synthase HpnC [Alphaproteobacteria bacterium]|jgi:squalene synthase HpnC|nr:squalene synthase HpnC [Alphaproteobacteria bacterium]
MTGAAETPSGKGAGDENFPVGSFLLPARLRPHVAVFYAFARAIDDIADNPDLAPEDKIARLDGFERALSDPAHEPAAFAKAHALRDSLAACGVTDRHARDLIAAFKQDAVKPRYADWDELMGYCRLSAAPVGRYLLDLHGEDAAGYPASDALCHALQVLNHLQDCQEDFRTLDRVYLPADWLEAAGESVAALDRPAVSPGLRRVLDQCLDGCEALMAAARTLPGRLTDRRLAMESAVIVRLADRLTVLLRRGDPLAGRVALSRADFARCGMQGMVDGLFGGLTGRRVRPAPRSGEA